MRDLYLKRNELLYTSFMLRSKKFEYFRIEEVNRLREKQDEAYKRWMFYDKYIKIGGKIKNERKKICTKEG